MELGRFIEYLRVNKTKGTIVIKPKVLKVVMFFGSDYGMNMDTRKSVNGIITTLGGTLLTCALKNQSNIPFIGTEA